MKKSFLLGLFALGSTVMFAQTTPSQKAQDMKEVRTDVRDLKKDEIARRADIKAGDKTAAQDVTPQIKADKKELAVDAKQAKADGVKHPVKRAKRQIHRHLRHH